MISWLSTFYRINLKDQSPNSQSTAQAEPASIADSDARAHNVTMVHLIWSANIVEQEESLLIAPLPQQTTERNRPTHCNYFTPIFMLAERKARPNILGHIRSYSFCLADRLSYPTEFNITGAFRDDIGQESP